MDIILNKNLNYNTKVTDFAIDPISKRIITTGEKITFLKDSIIEKEISGKVKNSQLIKYIKEKDQIFISNNFFITTISGKVYKYEGSKKKISDPIFDPDSIIEFINLTKFGKIIYIEDNILYSYDPFTSEFNSANILDNNLKTKGNYKIFTSNENIILKYRELYSQTNIINIFDDNLEKIFEIKTENNHTFSLISNLKYISGTANGEIEIWNIIESELYDSIKISNFRISYIEKNNDFFFIGLSNGNIIICNDKFKIIKEKNIFKDEIIKIFVTNNQLFVLSTENKIKIFDIVENDNSDYEEQSSKNIENNNEDKDYGNLQMKLF